MRRELTVVMTFLKKRSPLVKLNKTWDQIHSEHGIGQIHNDAIRFSDKERQFLQEWFINETGIDPQTSERLPETRLEAAATGHNEKIASNFVFSGTVRCARADGSPIPTTTGTAVVPPGSYLNIDPSILSLQDQSVVIMENGSLIQAWNQVQLPKEFSDSILLYRGHDSEATLLKKQLAEEPPRLNVGFYDFDPAGLFMGLTNGHDGILIPAEYKTWLAGTEPLKSINRSDSFWKQQDQLLALQKNYQTVFKPVVDHINKNTIAVMQEHIVTRNIPLMYYPLCLQAV